MKLLSKRQTLAAALFVTLGLTGWVASQDEPAPAAHVAVVRAPARDGDTAAAAPADRPASLDLARLERREAHSEARNLFRAETWQPPPPPPDATAQAAPQAPPVPFTYFGRLVEDGRATVFLARGNREYAVKQGDAIDNMYRIEEIRPEAIVLTYIPLTERQTLAIRR